MVLLVAKNLLCFTNLQSNDPILNVMHPCGTYNPTTNEQWHPFAYLFVYFLSGQAGLGLLGNHMLPLCPIEIMKSK